MADLTPEEQQRLFGTTYDAQKARDLANEVTSDPLGTWWNMITGNKDSLVGNQVSSMGGGINPKRSPNEAAAMIGAMQLARDVRNAPQMDALFRAGAQAPGRANPFSNAIADQSRPAQLALLAQMQQQMQGPSLAGMQGQRAMAQGGQMALRNAAMGAPARAGMVGAAQAGAGMAGDVGQARLAEVMRAQAGMGGLASGLRGGDLRTSELAARAGLQQRQQDDALRQFYAQMGGTLQNARDQALANRQITEYQLHAQKNARDIQNAMNFANQTASIFSMGATGGGKK